MSERIAAREEEIGALLAAERPTVPQMTGDAGTGEAPAGARGSDVPESVEEDQS